jgi:hypothetical protein
MFTGADCLSNKDFVQVHNIPLPRIYAARILTIGKHSQFYIILWLEAPLCSALAVPKRPGIELDNSKNSTPIIGTPIATLLAAAIEQSGSFTGIIVEIRLDFLVLLVCNRYRDGRLARTILVR